MGKSPQWQEPTAALSNGRESGLSREREAGRHACDANIATGAKEIAPCEPAATLGHVRCSVMVGRLGTRLAANNTARSYAAFLSKKRAPRSALTYSTVVWIRR